MKIGSFLFILASAAFIQGAQAQVKIGVAGPMTGSNAAFGQQMKAGADMAISELNGSGGVLGQRIDLVAGDDACDPRQAVAVARKFVSDRVAMVDGHYCSGSSIPASSIYAAGQILQITPASTNPKLTDQAFAAGNQTLFRMIGRDDVQGLAAARYIQKFHKGARIAILHDGSPYGKGVADSTQAALAGVGHREVLFDQFNDRLNQDFSSIIAKLRSANIQLVVWGGYHQNAATFIKQVRAQGLSIQMMGFDAIADDEFAQIAGQAADGVLMVFPAQPEKVQRNSALVQKFQTAGRNPEGYTLFSYAAVKVWAEAVMRAHSTNASAVAAALRSNRYSTVIGTAEFDEKGDIKNPEYEMYAWRDGKYYAWAEFCALYCGKSGR